MTGTETPTGPAGLRLGTCSWNYDSWVGLVYPAQRRSSVEYLRDYCLRYRTAEVDSWFYKIPEFREVESYAAATADRDFSFTCKAPQRITQVVERGKAERNPLFLSAELYAEYIGRLEPLRGRVDLVMLEFEYMNRDKMPGEGEFLRRLGSFLAEAPRDYPIGIECRNKNYLNADFFGLLRDAGAVPVFSEKLYLPPVVELLRDYEAYIGDYVAIRLLGGDRQAIEEKTGESWDKIVEPRDETPLVLVLRHLLNFGKRITVNVNNHYEGSAPLTIEKILRGLG